MPAVRRPRHPRDAAATRERILGVAFGAFARRGYGDVSLDDIAGAAGVRKAKSRVLRRLKEELGDLLG